MKKDIKGLAAGVMDYFVAYEWPGNIRELENAIERAITLSDGKYIQETALPQSIKMTAPRPFFNTSPMIPDKGTDLDREIDGFETVMITLH
jgi:DNA-binding NtrC family response regulator